MILKISPNILNKVSVFLKKGGVVVCPTDTVYGFLADAQNKKAVDAIYKIKERPRSKPLSLFVKDLNMAKELAQISKRQEKVLKKYWPGKYTFVLNRKPGQKLYGLDKKTVALRIPNYAFLKKLLKKINRPLSQTSVNISTKDNLNKISDIINQFESAEILIIDGGNFKKSKPSKIINISQDTINILRK